MSMLHVPSGDVIGPVSVIDLQSFNWYNNRFNWIIKIKLILIISRLKFKSKATSLSNKGIL